MFKRPDKMSQFTFYLDDLTKLKVLQKLQRMKLDGQKGTISSTIRVLLNLFAEDKINIDLTELIEKEYTYTTKKNKRSNL